MRHCLNMTLYYHPAQLMLGCHASNAYLCSFWPEHCQAWRRAWQHALTQNHTLAVLHGSGKTKFCLHVLLVLCIRAKCLQIETYVDEKSSVIKLCQKEAFG